MARRKKVTSSEDCDVEARGRKDNKGKKRTNVIVPPRNRASPNAIVKLYDDLTVEQKDVIRNDMNQGSMLDIKCDQLHNPMLSWLTKLYNPKERAFVIPGRGKIPINEESVHVTMGLPRGPIEVPFYVNYDIEDGIAEELFPRDGSRPKMSRVGELLVQYQGVDDNFKRLWMVYVICTVLAPTTDIKISNKVYPMLVNIAEAGQLNLCKFVVDYMHENLSRGKLNNACLLYAMLRYISSLNCEDYNLDLDGGDFLVNSWTRFAVETVAGLDQQDNDPYSFGKLELKEEFASELGPFGGPSGFEKWMSQHTHPSCTDEEKAKVGSLVYNFATGFDSLLSKLVSGWTSMGPAASESVEKAFNDITGHRANLRPRLASKKGKEQLIEEDEDDTTSDSGSSTEGGVILPANNKYELRIRSQKPTGQGTTSRSSASVPGKGTPRKKRDNVAKSPNKPVDEIQQPTAMDVDNLVIPIPDSDVSVSEGNNDGNIAHIVDSQPSSQHVDRIIRKQAAAMASRLSGSKRLRESIDIPEASKKTHDEVKLVVARELGLVKDTCAPGPMVDNTESDVVLSTPPTGITRADVAPSAMRKNKKFKRVASRKSPRLTGISDTVGDLGQGGEGDAANISAGVVDGQSVAEIEEQGRTNVAGMNPSTAIVLSPMAEKEMGGTSSNAIVISPSSHGFLPAVGTSAEKPFILSPLVRMPSPAGFFSNARGQGIGYGSPVVVTSELKRIVSELSAAVKDNDKARKGKHVMGQSGRSRPRDTRIGMFTPPSFDVLSQSQHSGDDDIDMNVDSSPDRVVDVPGSSAQIPAQPEKIVDPQGQADSSKLSKFVDTKSQAAPILVQPLAWSADRAVAETLRDLDRQEMKLAAYLDGAIGSIDDETADLWDRIERNAYEKLHGAKQGAQQDVGATTSTQVTGAVVGVQRDTASGLAQGAEDFVRSATPKTAVPKIRIKKVSKFCSSPFDNEFEVTAEQTAIFKELMCHTSKSRSSTIKGLDIVKFPKHWVTTEDLADSMMTRKQLSTRVCDVAVEYINEHCKVEKRIVIPYLVTSYLMDNKFANKTVTKAFKKTKDYSLSSQNQVVFIIYENLGDKTYSPHHWFVISLNMVAKRFEVLDSLRGENNQQLMNYAGRVISKIKEAWEVFYETAKNQIKEFTIKIIDVPRQTTPDDCGFFALNNAEKWNGELIPAMKADNVDKMKKIWPHRLLSSPMNATKLWRDHLKYNMV